MTPELLTGLAVLLVELRDWLNETDPGSLDADLIDHAIDVCGRARHKLVADGAR